MMVAVFSFSFSEVGVAEAQTVVGTITSPTFDCTNGSTVGQYSQVLYRSLGQKYSDACPQLSQYPNTASFPDVVTITTTDTVNVRCNGVVVATFVGPGSLVSNSHNACPGFTNYWPGIEFSIDIENNTPPSNLKVATTSDPTVVKLSWQNNSTTQTGVVIERSSSVQPFTQIVQLLGSSVTSYTDTSLSPGIAFQYRARAVLPSGYSDYSNVASVTTGCASPNDLVTSQQLKAVYDKLPNIVAGQISIPWYLQELAKTFTVAVNNGIAAYNLPGKSIQYGLGLAFQNINMLENAGGIYPAIGNKVLRFMNESNAKLGQKYGLSPAETNLLFSGMVSGDAKFTITSFKFNSNWALVFFGSNVSYQAQKDTSTPWPQCVSASALAAAAAQMPSPKPAPSVSGITPTVGAQTPNTFTISGSGFDTTGNLIELTPISTTAMAPTSSLSANVYSAFGEFWNFIKDLIPTVHAQATATSTDSGSFYGISDVPSNGSSLTFSVATTTPDGVYTVGIGGLYGLWDNTPYTITVSGNGAGDSTTEVGDLQVTVVAVVTATPAYSCPSGYSLTSANQCYKASYTVTTPATTINATATWTCPSSSYNMVPNSAGTYSCFLPGSSSGVTATLTWTCPLGVTPRLASTELCDIPATTVTIPASTVAATISSYSCPARYYLDATNQDCLQKGDPAPTNLIATAGQGNVALSWTGHNISTTVGIVVERSPIASSSFSVITTTIPTALGYIDTGLPSNQGFQYRVRAVDSDGTYSSYSNTASATTLTPQTAACPSGYSLYAQISYAFTCINLTTSNKVLPTGSFSCPTGYALSFSPLFVSCDQTINKIINAVLPIPSLSLIFTVGQSIQVTGSSSLAVRSSPSTSASTVTGSPVASGTVGTITAAPVGSSNGIYADGYFWWYVTYPKGVMGWSAEQYLQAYTAPALYTITVAPVSNGTISPSTISSVAANTSQTFTITPSSGYRISAITVDGVSVGTTSPYTISNVTANHTVSAMFIPIPPAALVTITGTVVNASTSQPIIPGSFTITATGPNGAVGVNTTGPATFSAYNLSPGTYTFNVNEEGHMGQASVTITASQEQPRQVVTVNVPITVPVTLPPPSPATVTYTCPLGATLSGTSCITKTTQIIPCSTNSSSANYSSGNYNSPCTNGFTTVTVLKTSPATPTYTCSTGYVLNTANKMCAQVVSMEFSTSTITATVFDAITHWFSWFLGW
jgi:hypothetical protein